MDNKKATCDGFMAEDGSLWLRLPPLDAPHLTQGGNWTTHQLPARWCALQTDGDPVVINVNGVFMQVGVSAMAVARTPKKAAAKPKTKADLAADNAALLERIKALEAGLKANHGPVNERTDKRKLSLADLVNPGQ